MDVHFVYTNKACHTLKTHHICHTENNKKPHHRVVMASPTMALTQLQAFGLNHLLPGSRIDEQREHHSSICCPEGHIHTHCNCVICI